MGKYNDDENDNLCHEQKNGLSGTALGLGAGGVAAAVPALIMSIINMVRDGRRHQAEVLARSNNIDMAAVLAMINDKMTISKLEAEKYTDSTVLELYKNQVNSQKEQDVWIRQNFKESFDAIVDIKVNEARNAERNTCLQGQVDRIGGVVEKLSVEMCDLKAREAVNSEKMIGMANNISQRFETQSMLRESQGRELHQAIKSLGVETYNTISCLEGRIDGKIDLEAERRICGDENIRAWASGTFVPGSLFLRPRQICGSVCCDTDGSGNNGNGNNGVKKAA